MSGIVSAKLDASNFQTALAAARVYSRRTPALAANVAGFYVARQARVEADKRSVPLSRIDTELTVDVQPIRSTRGRNKGQPLRSGRKQITAMTGGSSYKADVPFAWLLIGARAKPDSAYNRRTGQRFALTQHPFKGQRRSQFASIMAGMVRRMVSPRHSASGFIQSGWLACIAKAERFIPAKYRRGGNSGNRGREVSADHGGFTAAAEGASALCTIENDVGMSGVNSVLDSSRNEALWRVGTPALQAAIDQQAAQSFAYAAAEEAKSGFDPLSNRGVSYSG